MVNLGIVCSLFYNLKGCDAYVGVVKGEKGLEIKQKSKLTIS